MTKQTSGPDSSPDFIKSWMNIFQQMHQNAASGSVPSSGNTDANKDTQGEGHIPIDALISIFKTWGTLSSVMSEPAAASALASGSMSLPDIVSKFFQASFTSFLNSQAHISEKLSQMGKNSQAVNIENFDRESLKAWSDFYEKDLKRYLRIPQLGLVRTYQERFNHTIDRFAIFSAAFGEFLQILLLPMEKAFKTLHEKIEEHARTDSLPDDPRAYYQLWIKVLEGHYMSLYKTKRYTAKLAETLKAYEEFVSARNQVFTDALQSLPIPTNKDLDELYSELYQVKKRLRELERSVKGHGSSNNAGG